MRLLIVDQDPAFRQDLVSLVERDGHAVTNVASGAEARAVLEQEEFDVLFTGLRLDRHSGMALLADTRHRWPRMSVVMLTDSATVEEAVRALHQGAFDYLRKPVQPAQVHRVLELVSQELALRTKGAPLRDPVEYARALAAEGGYEVLLISPPPPPPEVEGVTHVDLEPADPVRIREAVEDFAQPRQRAAVVLSAVEELLARHREAEIVALLDAVRSLLEGKGPLAVAYDPAKITATGVLAVRASIASLDAPATLDSLANPIRRLVLRRLAEGDCTFSEALEAAHLDDTSKIAFHLRKLVESGLIEHAPEKLYRLSDRGKGAVAILRGIDRIDSEQAGSNRVFAWKSSSDAAH